MSLLITRVLYSSTNIAIETLNSRQALFYVIGMTGSRKKTVPDLVGFIVQRARQKLNE